MIMNMKYLHGILGTALAALSLLAGCTKDTKLEVNVAPVETILGPDDNLAVRLETSASAAVLFEWEPVTLSDSTFILYEVAFDVQEGDFSEPVAIFPSDNKGKNPFLKLTHKQINKIAAAAGIESAATGTMKWTVIASKGICQMPSPDIRRMEVTRLAGFTDIPAELYLSGKDVESDEDLNGAAIMRCAEEGVFELFTSLTQGSEYSFVDNPESPANEYYADGTQLKLGDARFTAFATGPHKIYLDFNSGAAAVSEISNVKWFHCDSNEGMIELPYVGHGVWELKGHVMVESDLLKSPKNPRYRFVMNYADGSQTTWGPARFGEDAMPGDNPDPSYFYAKEYTAADGIAPAKPKWKRNRANSISWVGFEYDFALILKSDTPYTHKLVEVSAP